MPRQTLLIATSIDVKLGNEGVRIIEFTDSVTGDVTLYPMPQQLATAVAEKLLAPSIEIAQDLPDRRRNGNGNPH